MKSLQATKLVLLALIIPAFWGCSSDKLTRGKAEKLIKEMEKFPRDEINDFIIESTNYGSASLTAAKFQKFQSEGLLTYTFEQPGFFGGGGAFATLTDKGKKYVVSDKYVKYQGSGETMVNVKVAKLDFGEITGIVEYKESNTA